MVDLLSQSDPAVALSIKPPVQLNGPLGTIGAFAGIQNQLNQNRLFQQTFAARQQAGQIMAAAPDMETGLANIMHSEAAPFMGEYLNQVRQSMLAGAQYQGAVQEQGRNMLGDFTKGLPAVLEDPAQWQPLVASKLAITAPEARPAVATAMNAIRTGLTDGLPKDPDLARAELNKRLVALSLSNGVTPDVIHNILGTPTTMELGNQKVPGLTLPAQGAPVGMPGGPGQFIQAQPGLGIGSPAGYQNIGGVPVPAPAVGAAGALGQGPVSGPGGPAALPIPTSASGRPLAPPNADLRAPNQGTGLAGANVLSPPAATIANKLADDWATTGLREFRASQTAQDMLTHMSQDYDTMVKGGGFLIPGAGAELRGQLGKVVNTVAQMTGNTPAFAPDKIASIEDFVKQTNRLGVSVTTQLLGTQREAAQTIQSMIKSVPSLSNTYMGGKLLLGGIEATLQRQIDQRNFENYWQSRNQGNLTGADEAFNKYNPPQRYAQEVLDKFGLNEKGFSSPDAVKKAVAQGYLTKQQAYQIGHDQFNLPMPAAAAGGQ